MYDFESLSISSGENNVDDADVLAISNLSLGDKRTATNELISKYMPYSPISPSPLKATVNFSEPDYSDKMDIDALPDEIAKEQPASINSQPNDKELDEVENTDEDEVADEVADEVEENTNDQTAMIKALLSPTRLGIALATKDMDKGTSPKETNIVSGTAETDTSFTKTSSTYPFTAVEPGSNNSFQGRSQTPWLFQVHNHHYYMIPGQGLEYNSQADPDISQLPVPWSADSRPRSKTSYAFTTYLQMALNTITILVICSTITAFFRTVRADIRSTWEHTKLELDFESSNCKVQYLANQCAGDAVVPALMQKCSEWEQCMNRNNDIYFRARTSMGARLVGEILNSLIEPLGWKALLSIIITLAIWCFSSNFLLGFIRAKSYYGENDTIQNIQPSPKSLTHSEDSPVLRDKDS